MPVAADTRHRPRAFEVPVTVFVTLLMFVLGAALVRPTSIVVVVVGVLLWTAPLVDERSTLLELVPVGMVLTYVSNVAILVFAEFFDINLFVGRRPAVLQFLLCAVPATWLVVGRRLKKRIAVASIPDLAVIAPIFVLIGWLGTGFVRSRLTMVSWFLAGGDHITHVEILSQLRPAGHTRYLEPKWIGGYPHGLHGWLGQMLAIDPGGWDLPTIVVKLVRFEIGMYLMLLWASAMVVRRLLSTARTTSAIAAAVGGTVAAVLLVGRVFVQYTLPSGFFTTVGAAWILASATLALLTFHERDEVGLFIGGAFCIALAHTWQILVLPVGVLLLAPAWRLFIRNKPPRRAMTRAVIGSWLLAGIFLVAVPCWSVVKGSGGHVVANEGASYPLPVVPMFLVAAVAIGTTALARDLRRQDLWITLFPPVLLFGAALVLSSYNGLLPDGQMLYYPKKIAWFGLVLITPLVGFWVGRIVAELVGVVRGGSVVVALAAVLGIVSVADYVSHFATLRALNAGAPGPSIDATRRLVAVVDRARPQLRDSSAAVLVIGAGSTYFDRQMTGLVSKVTNMRAPFLYSYYADDTLKGRCAYVADVTRVVVLDLRDNPTLEGCLKERRGVMLIGLR